MSTINQKDKAVAEVPDSDIEIGADFTNIDTFFVPNKKDGFRYYFASEKDDPHQPGTVLYCKRLGYEVCPDNKSDVPGHVIMRIPLKRFQARQKVELEQARTNQNSAMNWEPSNGEAGDLWRSDQHKMRRP